MSPSAIALTLFSYLWAAGTLFHLASYGEWRNPGIEVAVAFWLLLRPRSTVALVAAAAVQIQNTFAGAPYIPNHWLFVALVNATLIGATLLLAVKHRRITVDRGALYDIVAPAVRLAVFGLYFFAVFHKLNADWFNPDVSCGTFFYDAEAARVSFLPQTQAFRIGAIYAALGCEALIPLLLAFRQTRHAGILVGVAFHGLLGISPILPFYNFSALLLPLFALFLAPAFVAAAYERLDKRFLRVVLVTMPALFLLCALLRRRGLDIPGGGDPFVFFWTIYGLALMVAFVLLARRISLPRDASDGFFTLREPAFALLPIVVFLNGATPYLGLKTELSWAMFSNLRTEGGTSNHLIVPASLQPFGYQRDLVQLTRSSSSYLRRRGGDSRLLPYFELRRHPDHSVSYTQAGTVHTYKRISDDPKFRPLPYLLGKFMLFRPVDTEAVQRCVH